MEHNFKIDEYAGEHIAEVFGMTNDAFIKLCAHMTYFIVDDVNRRAMLKDKRSSKSMTQSLANFLDKIDASDFPELDLNSPNGSFILGFAFKNSIMAAKEMSGTNREERLIRMLKEMREMED